MNEPKRIQRQRTKGWRMPENTVYVGRPTKWGNPYVLGENYTLFERAMAVVLYRVKLAQAKDSAVIQQLRGKDLACWCPLDQPCHADVLLEWANEERDR